jgi:formyl-CoA transferase
MWPRVCKALGREDWLADPRLRTREDRARHADELEAGVVAWCRERTVDQVVGAMTAQGVPAAPVNDVPHAARDPHVAAREVLMEVPDPVAGRIHVSGKSIHLSRTPMIVGSAPTVGQHTDEVLSAVLGYSTEKIAALRGEGVI